jgi:hypothetical protein
VLEIGHKTLRTVSGKHNDASMWVPCFDIRNDTLDVGGRKTGVRCNYKVKPHVRQVLKDIGRFAIGLYNCYMVAMSSKYCLKRGSKYLRLRYDENVVNLSTSDNE